ncbi:reticulon-like protein B21 [Citrus sinensis]|uniref:Reticulon-like protein B21 n=1 Tax=Citrus sinensis TaxID=2711 RepID=A0ACB8IW33_CITSI|nr:reticulon-like protein B21 [Citrus sinensis]
MDVSSKRGAAAKRSVVAAGSVWESRMKSDEVKGGIKVFNGDDHEESSSTTTTTNNNNTSLEENGDKRIIKRGQGVGNLVAASGKRKTWKSESFDGPIIHNAKGKKNLDGHTKELTVSVDGGIKKGSILNKKGSERSPIQTRRTRSDLVKGSSDSIKPVDKCSMVQLRKVKSESSKGFDKSNEENEATPEENCKEFEANVECQEKVISSDATTAGGGVIESPPQVLVTANNDDDDDDNDDEEVKVDDIDGDEEAFDEEVEVEKKEINVVQQEQKPEKIVVNEVKKFNQFDDKTSPFISTVNKQPPPVVKRATICSNFAKPTTSSDLDEYQSFPETQTKSKLQNLVDLVMWRDVSKSAFVFGIGTFIIISSSYATDLNISFISVISYLGLIYLAVIFLYRAIICRGVIDIDDSSYVLGEGEAIWLLKLILPYLNEFLLKLKALFSGDPATTMKLAVLLFVLARCGSSITIWKMIKVGKFWIRRFRDAWDSCSHKKAVAVGIFTLVWNLSSMIARIWAAFMLFVALRYYQQSMIRDDWVEVEDDDDAKGSEETWHEPPSGVQKEAFRPNREMLLPNRLRRTLGQPNKAKKLS